MDFQLWFRTAVVFQLLLIHGGIALPQGPTLLEESPEIEETDSIPMDSSAIDFGSEEDIPELPIGEYNRTDLGGRNQQIWNYNSFIWKLAWKREVQGWDVASHLRFRYGAAPSGFVANKPYYFAFGYPNYAYASAACSSNGHVKCRFLHHCLKSQYANSYQIFLNNICLIGQNFVGVCCPQQTTAQTPAVANPTASAARPPATKCGSHDKNDDRIVGGKPADPEEYPWMAALLRADGGFCGGALISPQHVLTAAHCLFGSKPADWTVRIGVYDLSDGNSGADYRVSKFTLHPNHTSRYQRNDIALIKLTSPVGLKNDYRHICLPESGVQLEGENAYVVGFGSICLGCEGSNKLLELSVPIWNQTECKAAYNAQFVPLDDAQICAGFKEGQRDSCRGDSGGPLMLQNSREQWAVVGIVSFGRGCGRLNSPGIYTRVPDYVDWIMATVRAQF